MNSRDWAAFIRDGHGTTLRLAQLSGDLTKHLNAASDVVHVEHSYAVKCIETHQLLPSHFPALDDTIDQGAVVQDGDQHLVFFWFDEFVWNKWFRVTLKRCNTQRLIWLNTFHKTTLEQVRGKMRRLPVLRRLK